jgi:hypothetical protein
MLGGYNKMRFRRRRSNIGEGTKIGGGAGVVLGGLAATVATIWGGYEIGSVINDAINLQNDVGRGVLDVVVMGLVAGPAYAAGIYGGLAAGAGVGAIGGAISNGYKKLRGK